MAYSIPFGTEGTRFPETAEILGAWVATDQVESAELPLARCDVKELDNPLPLFDGHPRMRAIGAIIQSISDTDTTVLIRGESGVGKDLIARAVHRASTRRDGP